MGDKRLLSPELVQDTTEKIKIIKKMMKATQSRQKTYADKHHMPLKFTIRR